MESRIDIGDRDSQTLGGEVVIEDLRTTSRDGRGFRQFMDVLHAANCFGCLAGVRRFVRSFVRLIQPLLFFLIAFSSSQLWAQSRVIELTVFARPGNQAGVQQKWIQVLTGVGVDRVTSVFRENARPSIEEDSFGGSTVVSVKGVLKNGRLVLPGKKFARSDVAGMTRYFESLRVDQVDVAMAKKVAFGLTEQQLRKTHEVLSSKSQSSTVNVNPLDAVQTLLDDARIQVLMDTDAKARLSNGNDFVDERKGLAVGTALASMLGEFSLGLAPRRPAGGSTEFHVVDLSSTKEVWPIGQPSDQAPVALEPKLFQRQDIRIERFPLSDALSAVVKRSEARVLYNRAAISSRGIDLAKTEVSFSRKQVTYMVTLGKLLRQSEPPMEIEIRVDEAGSAFAWIDIQK